MPKSSEVTWIDEAAIESTLTAGKQKSSERVREILAKARELKGIDLDEMTVLMQISDPELLGEMFDTARYIKDEIYGSRLVLFAPMYVSNLCCNECVYCAFRVKNKAVVRRSLTQDEIANETKILIDQGHKRVLLVGGEAYPKQGFEYILEALDTVYSVKSGKGEIRRINVNIAPLKTEEFKLLKAKNIGTYQLFQETYHRDTYHSVHIAGPKKDFDWRITAMDRAMEAGIDDLGIGVLFGLFDWRYELVALMQHIKHLEAKFGVGPHTISVPRLEPATGSDLASQPPFAVDDIDFRKIVSILRIAVPYTGIIMSTRETQDIRRETFALGVSQISAGSRTNPGGYVEGEPFNEEISGQFSLGDHRPLDEVVYDLATLGYIPSFCTGCYRLGRTGADFMDLAKPGLIKSHCQVNAMSTFMEYLIDYASDRTKKAGEDLIEKMLSEMEEGNRSVAKRMVDEVKAGDRDVYV